MIKEIGWFPACRVTCSKCKMSTLRYIVYMSEQEELRMDCDCDVKFLDDKGRLVDKNYRLGIQLDSEKDGVWVLFYNDQSFNGIQYRNPTWGVEFRDRPSHRTSVIPFRSNELISFSLQSINGNDEYINLYNQALYLIEVSDEEIGRSVYLLQKRVDELEGKLEKRMTEMEERLEKCMAKLEEKLAS